MKSFGEILRETFKLKTTFSKCPQGILKFIKSSIKNILVISTLDVKITSDKITETLNDCEVYTVEEFIYSRSNSFSGDNAEVKVVTNCDEEIVNNLLQEFSQGQFNNKFVLISSESESVLQKLVKAISFDGLIETLTDYIEWDDFNSTTKSRILLKLQTHFQIEFEREQIKNILSEKVLIDLLNGSIPIIFKETLPKQLSYYIQRQLLTRNILSEKIFENKTGIFLFNGVERFELSRLAQGQLTRSSTEQLRQRTVRFITLDQSTHFSKICENEKSNKNIHWIKKDDDGRLRWIKSKGNISCIQKYVDKSQERLDEDKFLDYISNNRAPICITDSPGMGKTVILAQFGRRLRSAYPNRVILFVELTELVKQVKKSTPTDKIKSILVALETLTCQNELGSLVLKSKVHSAQNDILIELLLDGLDEVNSEDSELAYELLKIIKNSFKSVRLWVSSRPHLLLQLEECLNVLGYNMQPFNELDQVRFLTSFWQREKKLDEEKLKGLALLCLGKLKESISSEQDIAGIPLQCLLIAEVSEDDAIDYVNMEQYSKTLTYLAIISINSVADLFKCLIAKKLQKYFTVHVKNDFVGIKALTEMHISLSLELIFPNSFKKIQLHLEAVDIPELLKIGVIESSSSGGSRFIHRTFAEYFVAIFVIDSLQNCTHYGGKMATFFFEDVAGIKEDYELNHPVICHFLDKLIVSSGLEKNVGMSEYFKKHFSCEETMLTVSRAFAYDDFFNIFNLLDEIKGFECFEEALFDQDFIWIVVEFSSVEFVRVGFDKFEKFHAFDEDLQDGLLNTAIERGDFSILEFLLKEKGLQLLLEKAGSGKSRLLLHNCVKLTAKCSPSEIEEKCQIMQLIYNSNPKLIHERNDKGETPLLAEGVHFELMFELIRLGGNCLHSDYYADTVIHLTPERLHLSIDQYHSLLESIPREDLRQIVEHQSSFGETPLMSLIRNYDPPIKTLLFFMEAGAKVEPLLKFAINSKHYLSKETLKFLLENSPLAGTWKGNNGENFLHLIAKAGNLEAFYAIMEDKRFKDFVNALDINGLTPLDYAINSLSFEGRGRLDVGLALHSFGGEFKTHSGSKGQSFFHISSLKRNIQSVRLLLSLGLDVDEQDEDGNTPLHLSLSYDKRLWVNSYDTVEILLEHGADTKIKNLAGETPLCFALKNKMFNTETFHLLRTKSNLKLDGELATLIVRLMFESGSYFSEENRSLIDECEEYVNYDFKDKDGNTFVHSAAFSGDIRALKFLVEIKGAAVNILNAVGNTPLHSAVECGDIRRLNWKVVKELIDFGADVYAKNGKNENFLHVLLTYFRSLPVPSNHFDLVVNYFVGKGQAKLFNEKGREDGATPFQMIIRAVQHEPEDNILAWIVQNGVEFDGVDDEGENLLFYAVRGGCSDELVKRIMRYGGNYLKINQKGQSLLHAVADDGSESALKLLLEIRRMDVNERDWEGNTPLHFAVDVARVGDIGFGKCKLLMKCGADIIAKNNKEETPLSRAVNGGIVRVVKLFEGK